MIKIYNLKHKFDNLNVISDISFDVERNVPIAILGPSGCGKSTLLRCISGGVIPCSGTIEINGVSPREARLNKDIGFAYQDHALLDWKTVKENISLPNRLGSMVSFTNSQEQQRIDQLLDLTELKKFENYYPSQLSGGMKQRVSLARALFTNPKALLLDEPFAALDLLTRTTLAINLRQMINKISIPTILVTHSVEEAVIFSKRIIVLSSLPANIKEVIDVDIDIVDIKSLESNNFIKTVSHCRSLLLDEIKK